MHFQKGCTDRNRSMCYNKIEKVKRDVNNSKTGKLEKKEFIIPVSLGILLYNGLQNMGEEEGQL